MTARILLPFLFLLLQVPILSAQSASEYLPVRNSSWTVESVSTIGDSVLSSAIRSDSLVSIESTGGYSVYTILTSDDYTYKLDTRADTLFIRVAQVLRSEIFDDDLIELDVDPDDRLPIAIFSTLEDDEWDIYYHEETIELSDSIKAVLGDDINVEDEADIEIIVTGIRLPGENLSLPIGDLTTQVFETRIELTLTLYARVFGYTVPVPFKLLDGYALRTYTALERGLVKQSSEEYDVYAINESFNVNEYVFTLAANNSTMVDFTAGDPTFVSGGTDEIPGNFILHQNYPNPFNPVTTIRYTIPEQSHVNLSVYNILGVRVKTFVDSRQNAGSHRITFDATDLPSGVYFYTLQAGILNKTKRMVLSR